MNCLLGIEGFGPLRNEMCATEPHRSHLMFCLDNYLAMKIGAGASSRDCSSELQNMVQRIISVPLKASVDSDFESISSDEITALLVGLATFLKHLIDARGNIIVWEVVDSAQSLSKLCERIQRTVPRDLLRTYCLFFIGVVHYKGIPHYIRELILQRIHNSIRGFVNSSQPKKRIARDFLTSRQNA